MKTHFHKYFLPLLTYLSCLLLFSCNNAADSAVTSGKKQADTTHQQKRKATTPALNNDTLFVREQAAVFVMPDSSRIAKRIKEIGAQNFQIGADDYAYYLNEAGEFLDRVKIKTYDTNDKKVIKFIGANKTYEIIECNKLPELWSIYFFDPSKTARQIDMIAIEEEYKNYFKK